MPEHGDGDGDGDDGDGVDDDGDHDDDDPTYVSIDDCCCTLLPHARLLKVFVGVTILGIVRVIKIRDMIIKMIRKHCQRHNGPED